MCWDRAYWAQVSVCIVVLELGVVLFNTYVLDFTLAEVYSVLCANKGLAGLVSIDEISSDADLGSYRGLVEIRP